MYVFEIQKQNIFTEEGQRLFLSIRDKAKALLLTAGAFTMGRVISGFTGDSWDMLACVDRLVELGEIKEITEKHLVSGQNRIFTYVIER